METKNKMRIDSSNRGSTDDGNGQDSIVGSRTTGSRAKTWKSKITQRRVPCRRGYIADHVDASDDSDAGVMNKKLTGKRTGRGASRWKTTADDNSRNIGSSVQV